MRIALCFALMLVAGHAPAQSYPDRPVRVIVGYPPGGGTDLVARLIQQPLSTRWGQPVVIENRPGANTVIGAQIVKAAAADGYTLLMAIDSTLTMNQFLYAKLPYDPIRDFAPVSFLVWSPIILVVDGATGPKSVKELIDEAKASPGKVTFGSGTITTQLAGAFLKRQAGIDIVYVPYKGSPGTVQGLLSNDVRFILDGVTSSAPHIRSGKFRALARLGNRTISAFPALPTLATEAGFAEFDVAVWLGMVAPAGTPADIINRIHQEIARVLALQDVRDRLAASGLDPASSTPTEFGAFIRKESERWGKLIKETGITLE